MVTTLDKILDYKRQELEHRRRQVSLKDVQLRSADQAPAMEFLGRFEKDQFNVIAEVKKASPSAGVIRKDFNPLDIAIQYKDFGAQALSVLTDEHFFQGRLQYLSDIKARVDLPVLRKDFTLNEYDIFEGRAFGADAILLIVAALDDFQLKDYQALIQELGMTALIEVHNQEEWDRCPEQASLLGINNRDLKTFKTNVKTTIDLLSKNKAQMPIISESGLKDHETLKQLNEAGVHGFLIGESLMRATDIGLALQKIKGQA